MICPARPALLLLVSLLAPPLASPLDAQSPRPNILWITSEDNGPHMGCYGDEFADTPNLDALAARGMRYERAWSNAPVCATARTTIITGMYATSLGAESMRTMVELPAEIRLFPELLREAGYYCTNRSKQDYNVEQQRRVWDASSGKAHWRRRAEGQPFFAVMNLTTTHESRIRKRPHKAVHDPAGVRVPAYHPDHPAVRQDWAQYYDKMTQMDAQAGAILAQLEADGLADDTIVFYYGDHGMGLPRCKRWPYDSGLRVPMLVAFPKRFRHLAPPGYETGGASDRLVSFVDLAPTVLGIAGVDVPAYMQGGAFAGLDPAPARKYMFGYRGRMDERVDLVRSVTDGRHVYIRNYMPHREQGAFLEYMFQTPTTRVWKELFDAGKLSGEGQRRFWQRKPPEELYDLHSDPDEVRNLADEPDHEAAADRLRSALREHVLTSRDMGFLPEAELHARSEQRTPRAVGLDSDSYPLQRILAAADQCGAPEVSADWVAEAFSDPDAAVRYWAATSLLSTTGKLSPPVLAVLRNGLDDSSHSVRIASAESLIRHGTKQHVLSARSVLIAAANPHTARTYPAILALNAIDNLADLTSEEVAALRATPRVAKDDPARVQKYPGRLLDHILEGHPPAPTEHVYKTIGGVELDLRVFQPADRAPKRGRPAVVFFHGGGWNSGSPAQFYPHCEHLAARGIVGISAAYRLKKKHGSTPYDCAADGKSAMRWVRRHAAELGIDPARVGAGGGSAGGQVAATLATVTGFDDEPDATVSCVPDALVLFNPVFDNGPGGWGHKRVEEHWRDLSPLHNIRAGIPPSLVCLGTEDKLIPVATARRFAARVREVGGHCELRLHEGQGHGFFNARNPAMYAATVAEMDAFLRSLGWLP